MTLRFSCYRPMTSAIEACQAIPVTYADQVEACRKQTEARYSLTFS